MYQSRKGLQGSALYNTHFPPLTLSHPSVHVSPILPTGSVFETPPSVDCVIDLSQQAPSAPVLGPEDLSHLHFRDGALSSSKQSLPAVSQTLPVTVSNVPLPPAAGPVIAEAQVIEIDAVIPMDEELPEGYWTVHPSGLVVWINYAGRTGPPPLPTRSNGGGGDGG
jgi:hypothetical protein